MHFAGLFGRGGQGFGGVGASALKYAATSGGRAPLRSTGLLARMARIAHSRAMSLVRAFANKLRLFFLAAFLVRGSRSRLDSSLLSQETPRYANIDVNIPPPMMVRIIPNKSSLFFQED